MNRRFEVRRVEYLSAREALASVRETVFIHEQGVPREIEQDAIDADCQHVLALDADGAPVGTGRLTPERTLGRIAVLPDWRGHGVGDALLVALLDLAYAAGLREVSLHSQTSAVGFYERHGFLPQGAPYMEAGIEHLTMSRKLHAPAPVSTREQARAALVAVASGARRRLNVYSRALDPGLLDSADVMSAFRRLATRGGELRFLVQDPATPQRALSPLIPLAQRLSSAFSFRAVEDPVDLAYPSALAVNDRGGWYFRVLGDRVEGEMQPDGEARARELRLNFDSVWERARVVSEYRALGI